MIINFYSPEIPETKKSVKNDSTHHIIKGFPYQYFKKEVLTDKMVEYRVKRIYISFMIYSIFTFSLGSTVSTILQHATIISLATSIEKLIPNQLNSQTDQQELLIDLREGESNFSSFAEVIIRIILILTMSENSKLTERFPTKGINYQHLGHQGHANGRTVPKLQENPVNRNNPGRQTSYRSSNHPSLDELSNSLSPEYSQFQSKYHTESLPKRFDTKNYSIKEFKKLSIDPSASYEKYDNISIDKAKEIIKYKLENSIFNHTRANIHTVRRIDLDFKVDRPSIYTYLYIKTPVGSEILK